MPCHRVAPENIEAFVKQLERDGEQVLQLVPSGDVILVLTVPCPAIEKRGAA